MERNDNSRGVGPVSVIWRDKRRQAIREINQLEEKLLQETTTPTASEQASIRRYAISHWLQQQGKMTITSAPHCHPIVSAKWSH